MEIPQKFFVDHCLKCNFFFNWPLEFRHYCTFVPPPPIVIDDSSWKNAAESFTVALTLTLGGGTKVQ